MKDLTNWIANNPALFAVITLIVLVLVVIVILLYKYKKSILYKAALYAVTKAEEEFGSSTGRIKFAQVYTEIISRYPMVSFFFTEKQLTNIIEDALVEMKRILATKQAKLEAEEKEKTE